MFGHDSLPCRVFSYGAKPPIEAIEIVNEQMYRAHRYRNALVHLDRIRRAWVDETLARISPELFQVEKSIGEIEEKCEAAREEIRRASAKARKKVRPPAATAIVREANKELKPLRARRKELRTALFASPEWRTEQQTIEEWVKDKAHRLRAASKLFWGTYLVVEQSVKRSGPPPRFHSWDEHGHLALQLQLKGGKGKGEDRVQGKPLSVAEAFRCQDSRLRIEPVPAEAYERGGRRLQRTKAYLRVGTNKDRSPIWAVVPVELHRPLPPDAEIKWVHLLRFWSGSRLQWKLDFVLSRASDWTKEDAAKDGMVGIDVGWRVLPDGSLRVARWCGSDGDRGGLALPARWISGVRKVEDIRSIRDKLFDGIRDGFAEWLKKARVPDWLSKATTALPQWKSQERLASVVVRWREARFDGDHEQFAALETWRKRDDHLYLYESNLRNRLENQRKNIYQDFALLRRRYRRAILEDLDLREFHKKPKAEESAEDKALKMHTRDACLSLLFDSIENSFAEVYKVPAYNTTRQCAKCGSIEDWDRKNLMHTCSKCGAVYDQDDNAAENLLRWDKEPPTGTDQAPADEPQGPEEAPPKTDLGHEEKDDSTDEGASTSAA